MNSPLDSLSETSFEFLVSRNGASTASWQGKLLCSSRDPLAEASGWVRNQGFAENKKVIVLGLGAGHHIRALNMNRPQQQIIVLEHHQILIDKFISENQLTHVEIKNHKTLAAIEIKNLVQASLPVFGFRPSWAGLEKEYEILKRNLTGLDVHSLAAQAEAQGLYHLGEILSHKNPNFPADFISIKDITDLMEEDKGSREAQVWQLLRELVK